jgi:hypothetical protein
MTTWTEEFWEVDGTPLHTYAWGVELLGMDNLPSRRGSNFVVPYRHGEVWRPKQFGPRAIGLAMWVLDQNENGTAGGISQTRANVERLKALFAPTDRQLQITKRIKTAEDRAALFNGVGGEVITTPNRAENTVTSDIDVRFAARMANWQTPTARQAIVTKYLGTGNQRAVRFSIGASGAGVSGKFNLFLSTDGIATPQASADGPVLPFGNNQLGFGRFTWRASDGRVQFFTAIDGENWIQIGANQTIAIPDLHPSTAPWKIGGSDTSADPASGEILWAEIRDGIDGPVVARFDASDPGWGIAGSMSAVDDQGNVWTRTSGITVDQPVRTLTALAEALGTLDFTPDENFSEILRFAVELQMADPFWYGDEVTASVPFAGGGVYNPGSAIARKMLIRLNGPLTNPRLENQSTTRPVSITYNGTIAGGTYVELDTDLYTAYDNLGANQISKVNHSGAHSWMELAPGGNVLLFTVGTGSGSADFTFLPPYL